MVANRLDRGACGCATRSGASPLETGHLEARSETIYGTRKKLRLVACALGEYRLARGLAVGDVSVLDIGCGTGATLAQPLADLGYRVVGIDVDEQTVRVAKRRKPTGVRWLVGDVLSLADRPVFDAIVCSELIEHLSQPEAVLVKCRGLLRPRGRLIVTVPNGYGGFEWEEVLWSRCGFRVLDPVHRLYLAVTVRIRRRQFRQFFRRGLNPPADPLAERNTLNQSPHVQFFTLDRLDAMLGAAGFDVLSVVNLSFLCGKITQTLLGDFRWFVRWTTRVADRLPAWSCSNWLLVCERE